MKEHELKCHVEFYADVQSGRKPFELRFNDRGFQTGDVLHLRETDGFYTGRSTRKVITYMLNGWGMKEGYVALGLAPPQDAP